MKYLRLIAPLAALTFAFSGTAKAQDLSIWCQDQARQLCGNYDMPLATCMESYDLWPLVPNECIGDLQTVIEIEREAGAQRYAPAPSQPRHNVSGLSHGGILRSGPGMQYRKLASLREADWLEILENTGVWFDGYQWFRVDTPMGIGYHWGGIFCVERGQRADGVLNVC